MTVAVEGGPDVLVTMTRTMARKLGLDEGAKVWLTAAQGATTVPVMQADSVGPWRSSTSQ